MSLKSIDRQRSGKVTMLGTVPAPFCQSKIYRDCLTSEVWGYDLAWREDRSLFEVRAYQYKFEDRVENWSFKTMLETDNFAQAVTCLKQNEAKLKNRPTTIEFLASSFSYFEALDYEDQLLETKSGTSLNLLTPHIAKLSTALKTLENFEEHPIVGSAVSDYLALTQKDKLGAEAGFFMPRADIELMSEYLPDAAMVMKLHFKTLLEYRKDPLTQRLQHILKPAVHQRLNWE